MNTNPEFDYTQSEEVPEYAYPQVEETPVVETKKDEKKKKNKKTSNLKYLNPKFLAQETKRLGGDFSVAKYIKFFLIFYIGLGVLAYFYRLQMVPIIIIFGVSTLFIPSVFIARVRNSYERKKFDDLTNYMEQMLYSFKRDNKIRTALQDTSALFTEGEMNDAILRAVDYIREANTSGDIYREALALIEEDYGCKRLNTLHDFFSKVESAGGEYDLSVDILLKDRSLWVDRVYEMEKDKKNVKTKILMGIGISMAVGLLAVYIIPSTMDIPSNPISQAATTFMFLANLAVWYISFQKLSGSLIEEKDSYTWEEMKKKYDTVFHADQKKKTKKFTIVGIMLIPVGFYLYFQLGIGVAIVTFILAYIIASQPQRQYKMAYKKVRAEVEKAFPDWLLSMSLLLQTDNVHIAISKSIDDAPEILKEELIRLEDEIAKDPNGIEPYIHFMEIFEVSDILSAMKILYSIAEYGAKDVSQQILALVDRNAKMADKAERLRTEDFLSAMGFFVLAPMFTGVIKLVVDMGLIVFYLVSQMKMF